MYLSLLWQAIPCTVCTLIALVFFKDKPKTPPTKAIAQDTGSLSEGAKSCVKDGNMLMLIIVFGIVLGIMNTLGTAIGIITS